MPASISASISAPIPSLVSTVAAPVAAVTLRWRAAIARAVVPIARPGASVISAAVVNDYTRLNNRCPIAITRFVTCGIALIGGICGIAAAGAGGVSGRAVRVDGTAGH